MNWLTMLSNTCLLNSDTASASKEACQANLSGKPHAFIRTLLRQLALCASTFEARALNWVSGPHTHAKTYYFPWLEVFLSMILLSPSKKSSMAKPAYSRSSRSHISCSSDEMVACRSLLAAVAGAVITMTMMGYPLGRTHFCVTQ